MKSNLLLVFYFLTVVMISCTKDASEESNISDVALSSMITSSDDFVLIRTTKSNKNADWKIKMNAVASKAYSEGSKIFPVNSMIIKEKYNSSGKIDSYDIMYKAPADKNSIDGWLWSQVSADGHVIYNASKRGASCQSCHETQITK